MKTLSVLKVSTAACAAALLAACSGGGDTEEAEAPEEEEVVLADPCPDSVQSMRGSEEPLTCSCPAEAPENASVWGVGPYSDDSNVCLAARHAGLVSDEAANVTINFMDGRSSYTGSTANGVESRQWGEWGGSFAFEGGPMNEPEEVASALEACPTTATALRGSGETVECSCTQEAASVGNVWGSGPYTDDSRICRAAVHAGVIDAAGGDVSFTVSDGLDEYSGSNENGIETRDYGEFSGSYDFNEG